ncbi:MAG: tetratricopeptide repeat protein [Xanthobacteraceae bacterium]|nr:tetratricopeptide repeat protein [Xanthobacteraceae bacterium]
MAETSDHLLARAMQLHRQGAVIEAIDLYNQILEKSPRNVAALNLLGIAYFQSGESQRAVAPLQEALALNPDLPSGHYNLGRILQGLKRYEEARPLYELALARQPGDPEIHNNLGTLLRALGRPDEAIMHFRKALERRPDYAAVHVNLGNALHALGRHLDAISAFETAVTLNAGVAEAYSSLGHALAAVGRHEEALKRFDTAVALQPGSPIVHFDRGNALHRLERFSEAVAAHERALRLDPSHVDAHANLGAACYEMGHHDRAVDQYRKALAIRPDDARTTRNLADALVTLDRFDEAIAAYRVVTAREPGNGQAHFGLASALEAIDGNEEALQSYRRAIDLMPDDPRPKWFKAYLDLSLGHLEAGWSAFEARWAARDLAPRPYPQRRWDGGAVAGKLLVWGEQGLGDQIIYASMIEDLRRRVPSICLEVAPRLVGLFARSFSQIEVVPMADELYGGAVAAQVPLASLAPHLRPDWQAFRPAAQGYLKADPARAAAFRARLANDGQRLVGLSWQSTSLAIGKAKSASLRDFAAVLRLPGCRFVDLQYDDAPAERDAVARELDVNVDRLADLDLRNDIEGAAALISACDLVFTVSNTNAHLAGALGKPTWVLLPVGGARLWYWFRGRNDSPWYPRVHLKRRSRGQSWTDLVAATAPEIEAALARQ